MYTIASESFTTKIHVSVRKHFTITIDNSRVKSCFDLISFFLTEMVNLESFTNSWNASVNYNTISGYFNYARFEMLTYYLSIVQALPGSTLGKLTELK